MRYVYGVIRADHPVDEVKGVGAPPAAVRAVTSGSLAAVVSDVADDFTVDEHDARAHLDVLIGLLADGPVVPVRLGTVAPDDESLGTLLLDVNGAELQRLLDDLDGLVEVHVDAYDSEADAIAEVTSGTPLPSAEPLDLGAKIDLGQQVATMLVEHRVRVAEAIVNELRPVALRDAPRSLIEGPEDPVLRWAFLIKREDLRTFDEAILAVRSHHPTLAIEYVGPLPATHFLDWSGPEQQIERSENTAGGDNADNFGGEGNWGW